MALESTKNIKPLLGQPEGETTSRQPSGGRKKMSVLAPTYTAIYPPSEDFNYSQGNPCFTGVAKIQSLCHKVVFLKLLSMVQLKIY
jgi:hypothetical protein